MTVVIGYNTWGIKPYTSPSPSVRNIYNTTLQNSLVGELSIREKTNFTPTNTKDTWQMDTKLLAKFLGDLEAGNIQNEGLQIVQFAIKRREQNDLDSITLDKVDFNNNSTVEYSDYTQPASKDLIYSIVPIGENGLEGNANEIKIESDFVGWWIIDKDTNKILSFDKFIDSEPNISTKLNQGRTVIETLNKFPQIYYDDREYHSFSLSAMFNAEEWRKSGQKYEEILDDFIKNHKSMIVKSGNGKVYVCDINNPQVSEPLNQWDGRDYFTLSIDLTEIQDYEEFMNE